MANGKEVTAQPSVKLTMENVSPRAAAEYLAQNVDKNRAMREALVAQYAEEMTAGRFNNCCAPVVFNTEGRLIDGQHRMRAIVLSGKTIRLPVLRNAATEAFKYIDIGAKRSMADRTGLERNVAETAAALYRLCTANNRPAPDEVIRCAKVFAPQLHLVERGRKIKGATAVMRGAVAIIMARCEENAEQVQGILQQYEAFRDSDYAKMDAMVAAFHKAVYGVSNSARQVVTTDRGQMFGMTFAAFAPEVKGQRVLRAKEGLTDEYVEFALKRLGI